MYPITTKHATQLRGIALREAARYVPTEEVEDIAQDALLVLTEREGEGKIDSHYVAFALIKQIVFHRSMNFMDGTKRRAEITMENGAIINRDLTGQSAESLAADPYENYVTNERAEMFDLLSPVLRRAFIAHYVHGITVSDMAEWDQVSEAVIYKRLQRARDTVTGDGDGY